LGLFVIQPISFYDEGKATTHREHYNNYRFPKVSNSSGCRHKVKNFIFEAETESVGPGYDLNCQKKNSINSKDESNMDNGAFNNNVPSLPLIEEEKKFKVSLKEGVLLLKVAKRMLNEEKVVGTILPEKP
jgi:septin family protein